MSQHNVNTTTHECSDTIFLTTKKIAYRHMSENRYQHIETGLTYSASSDGRLFDTTDFKEMTTDGHLILKPVFVKKHVKIGQVINHVRYGEGVVYAIYGVQGLKPITSLLGGGVVSGGSAEFDIVFSNDTRTEKLPESILCGGLPWSVSDNVVSQEDINKRLVLADEREAREKAETEKKQTDFNEAVSHFKTAAQYKDFIQGDDKYSGKLAARNIRMELKTSFKGIKFSVRKTHYGSLSVNWTDGPKKKEVEAITGKYETGRFNSYEDYHYTEVGAFNEVLGGANYIFLTRSYSDDFIHEAIGVLVDKYASYFRDKDIPTVDDYRKGRLYNQGQDICARSFQDDLWQIINEL